MILCGKYPKTLRGGILSSVYGLLRECSGALVASQVDLFHFLSLSLGSLQSSTVWEGLGVLGALWSLVHSWGPGAVCSPLPSTLKSLSSLLGDLVEEFWRGHFRGCSRLFGGYLEVILDGFEGRLEGQLEGRNTPKNQESKRRLPK